jgi:hypothetical protein
MKSNKLTSIKPKESDVVLTNTAQVIQNVLPNHTLDIKASVVERGALKNVDKRNRTHYIKLDCSIKDSAGTIAQVFNRFVLLDESIIIRSIP